MQGISKKNEAIPNQSFIFIYCIQVTMKYPSTTHIWTLASLVLLAQAQPYSQNATTLLPWQPRNASSVGQSTIFNGTYYLADQTNALIRVINLTSPHQNTTIGGFSGVPIAGKGGVGAFSDSNTGTDISTDDSISPSPATAGASPRTAGPNGILVLPDRNELYVGDAGGTTRVINLHNNSVIGNISTGSQRRADTMAYNPRLGRVLVVNPLEYPRQTPSLSLVDVQSRRVVGNVSLPANTTASNGEKATFVGQPAWDNVTDKFYVPVRATRDNPGGEIDEVDASTLNVTNVIGVRDCHPTSIVFGPAQNLFVGCGRDQIRTYGYGFSLILNLTGLSSPSPSHNDRATVVGNISDVSGVGQAVYSPSSELYYVASYHNLSIGAVRKRVDGDGNVNVNAGSDGKNRANSSVHQVAIIDARTRTLLQTIRTDNVTAQTVAVDPHTNQMVVPLQKEGIALFDMEKKRV